MYSRIGGTARLAIACFAGSLCIGIVLGAPRTSNATDFWTRRNVVGSCTVAAGSGNDTGATDDLYTSTSDIINRALGSELPLNCHVVDEDLYPKTNYDLINLHGWIANNSTSGRSVYARVCIRFYASDAGWCGTEASSTSTTNTNYQLTISPESGQTLLFHNTMSVAFPNEFGYIHVRLPTPANEVDRYHYSTLRGYYSHGTI